MCEMRDDNISASLSICLTTHQSSSLFVSLTRPPVSACFPFSYQTLALSVCLQPRPFPSLVYCVRITCPSASRMRHAWGLKIKDERGTDGCKERGEGDWWLGVRMWRGEEGGLALEAAACRRKVINPSIHSCLFMYLFSSPSPVNVVPLRHHGDWMLSVWLCQWLTHILMKVSKSWVMRDNGQNPQ